MQCKIVINVMLSWILLTNCNTQEPIPDKRGYIVEVGDQIEDFNITLIDGSAKKLSQFQGSVIVLNFFASW